MVRLGLPPQVPDLPYGLRIDRPDPFMMLYAFDKLT